MVRHPVDRIDGPMGRLVVTRYGDAKAGVVPLLLVHPLNTGAAIWHRVAVALSVVRPVIVPDLRGHGASDKHGPFGATHFAADVAAVMSHYRLDRFHLAGGSIGGPVSVLVAAAFPDQVISIASLGGSLTLDMPEEALSALAAKAAGVDGDHLMSELIPAALAQDQRQPGLIGELVAIAGGRSSDLIVDLLRGAFPTDVTVEAAKVTAPALIVNGSEDETCPPQKGQAMAAALDARLLVLEGVGHIPMVEVPATVAALLADHCAKAEQGRG